MQVNHRKEVVPNALIGRELDVLAAVVLGGARLGGGRGSVLGCLLGVLLVAITQNGLNLLGISPFAFKMVIGLIILVAISTLESWTSRPWRVRGERGAVMSSLARAYRESLRSGGRSPASSGFLALVLRRLQPDGAALPKRSPISIRWRFSCPTLAC